jgi:K+-sensing histidine kinase KdpD
VTGLIWPLQAVIGLPSILLAYLLAVFLVAYRAGLGPSVLTAVLSASAFAFFYAAPIFSFAIRDLQNLLGLLVMLIVATVTSGLAGKLREQAAIAARRQHQATILYQLTEDFSNAVSVDEAVALVPRHFRQAFGQAAFLLLPDGTISSATKISVSDLSARCFVYDQGIVDQLFKGAQGSELSCVDKFGTRHTLLMSPQGPLCVC